MSHHRKNCTKDFAKIKKKRIEMSVKLAYNIKAGVNNCC